ncbi:hypothetical protein C1646_759311 [Rhizophagus diaphanus]|nr:hypothetical protein C1646_759311 [Rhizophagus diaphanus] [Rhizophagus sp. MUCL 43196]
MVASDSEPTTNTPYSTAEKDHIDAMLNLTNRYYNGKGTGKNLEKAFHWYQKAAEKDHIDAMFNPINRYYNGEGIEKNLEKPFIGIKKQQKR